MIFKFSRSVTLAMAFSLVPVYSIAMPDAPADKAISIETARKLADNVFKKATIGKVKNFSVRLIENSATEWVFVYEDEDVLPRPGSEIYVVVSKQNLETSWHYGK